jgi:hypothetical protein
MSARQLLPNRRRSEIATFDLDGTRFRATVSRFNDGRLAEVFIDTDKPCSGVSIAARDLGIAASLALQSGCPAATLRKALQRLSDGSPAGPLAAALDLFEEASQ